MPSLALLEIVVVRSATAASSGPSSQPARAVASFGATSSVRASRRSLRPSSPAPDPDPATEPDPAPEACGHALGMSTYVSVIAAHTQALSSHHVRTPLVYHARRAVRARRLYADAHRRTSADTFVLAIETPMATDDPRYAISNYDEKLGKLVAPGLTTVETPTGEPRLLLAAVIDRIDPTTVDVTLRPDAKFSDGSPVTADDVARTYASVLDASCGSPSHAHFVDRYASVEPRGARTVARFHLRAAAGHVRHRHHLRHPVVRRLVPGCVRHRRSDRRPDHTCSPS